MRFSLLLAAAPFALAACAQPAEESEAAAGTDTAATATPTDTAMADPAAAPGATDPQGFVNTAAASDMFEIESGKLAQANGKSEAVKEFGGMLVRDHTKSTAELKTAAGSANVTPAPEMTAKQQSDLAALRTAGENFDTLFKQQQVAAHEQALALLRSQAENGTAASLKAFAAKTAPVVEQHLQQVRQLP